MTEYACGAHPTILNGVPQVIGGNPLLQTGLGLVVVAEQPKHRRVIDIYTHE